MRVRASIGKRCSECKIIRRHGIVRVICKRNPRHKQRQGSGKSVPIKRKVGRG